MRLGCRLRWCPFLGDPGVSCLCLGSLGFVSDEACLVLRSEGALRWKRSQRASERLESSLEASPMFPKDSQIAGAWKFLFASLAAPPRGHPAGCSFCTETRQRPGECLPPRHPPRLQSESHAKISAGFQSAILAGVIKQHVCGRLIFQEERMLLQVRGVSRSQGAPFPASSLPSVFCKGGRGVGKGV